MPAIDFDASDTPADIVAGAALTAGTDYTVQNVSTTATLFLREQTTQPAIGTRAFKIEAGSVFTIKPTGAPIWVWTDNTTCPLIVAEAV